MMQGQQRLQQLSETLARIKAGQDAQSRVVDILEQEKLRRNVSAAQINDAAQIAIAGM